MSLKNGTMSRFILFLLPLLTACGADDTVPDTPQGAVSIGFSTNVEGRQTRSEALNTDNLLSMGIFAYYTGSSNWTAANTPNFMYNQPVTRTDNNTPWTYSPVKYWPNNEADKISFFAYAPHNAAGVTPSGNTVAGFPYLDYTVPTAEAKQIDLLAATPLMDQSYASNPATPGDPTTQGNISFTMHHALTKISIYARSSDLSAGKVVNSLSVTAPKSGRLTYKTDGFDWSASEDKSTYTATKSDVTISTTTTNETVLLGTFYLIPDRAKSSLNITYTLKGEIAGGVNPPTDERVITGQAFPDTYEWTPGTSIVYTVNITRTDLEIVAESSSMEWTNSVIKNIEYFEADDLKPGDYYYNDGSWSDGGLRMIDHNNGQIVWKDPLPDRNLTNPQTSGTRECIGVVFSTRMSENDKARGWTHGYVMGLSILYNKWSPGDQLYDTPLPNITILEDMYNDLEGYNNTYTIKESLSEEDYKLKHPLFYDTTSFATPRPADTSGWFLLSVGQMWDLFEVLGEQMPTLMKYRTSKNTSVSVSVADLYAKINQHLTNAGGSAYMTGTAYWFSSTENSEGFAILLNTYNASVLRGLYKWAPDVRAPGKGFPVLAF